LAHRLVKAGIDDDRAGRADDRPDEKIERLQNVVRIAIDKISRRTARMMAIANGVNFVKIVRHSDSPHHWRHRRTCSGIHVFDFSAVFKAWMGATSAAMTIHASLPQK